MRFVVNGGEIGRQHSAPWPMYASVSLEIHITVEIDWHVGFPGFRLDLPAELADPHCAISV